MQSHDPDIRLHVIATVMCSDIHILDHNMLYPAPISGVLLGHTRLFDLDSQ